MPKIQTTAYLDYLGLQEYDSKIKNEINTIKTQTINEIISDTEPVGQSENDYWIIEN